DVLFAKDADLKIQPQMAEGYTLSDDKLTYTITLRDGLVWSDGAPVTPEDCIASIKRWGARDASGQLLMKATKELKAVDGKSFQIVLKEPFGLVLDALSKVSSNVPFMMPKRIAETDPYKQIEEFIGSGPFIFKKDEWKPGEKLVYVKNPKYKPRPEPASGLAGGKVVKLDRVEWVWIPDSETQLNALIGGEIDMIESVAYDHLPVLEKAKGFKVIAGKTSNQYGFRMTWLQPPFNNIKVRQAVAYALSQDDFLQASVGDKRFYRPCKAMFTCDSPLASTAGMDGLIE